MLFLSQTSLDYENMYLTLLVHYSQVDTFNALTVIKLNELQQKSLNKNVLPLLINEQQKEISSIYEISKEILAPANFDKVMIGVTEEEQNSQRKYFELIH